MVIWNQFVLDVVQAVATAPEPWPSFSTGKAVAAVLSKFGERFNGDMKSLPADVPVELVPAEIPRVTLQSDDGDPDQHREAMWKVNLGPARVDCVWHNTAQATDNNLRSLADECAAVLRAYIEKTGMPIGRVALVVGRFSPCADPAQELIDRFCSLEAQAQPFNRSASFEIHNHKVYEPQGLGLRVNSWVRCKSAKLQADDRPAIVVHQDFNSLVEEAATRRFDGPTLARFYATAGHELDDILRRYFPEPGSDHAR